MGSSSSKDVSVGGAQSSSTGGGGREPRSRVARGVFGSSCFGTPSTLNDDQIKEEDERSKGSACTNIVAIKSNPEGRIGCIAFRAPRAKKISMLPPSATENDRESEEGLVQTDSGGSSNSTNQGGHSIVSASLSFSDSDSVERVHGDLNGSLENSDETPGNVAVENASSYSLGRSNTSVEARGAYCERDQVEAVDIRIGHPSRRSGPQEPLEGSVRFSRTLSVGRLRDRVLRRTSISEGLVSSMLLEERHSGHSGPHSSRRVMGGRTRSPSSSGSNGLPNPSSNHPYHIPTSVDNIHDYDSENPQLREASNRGLVGTPVQIALQRMGSRFENISGHDRSCIISGQHRTGRCTCRTSNHVANHDDDTGTRASISRIVMLAEALFEVLDEIHQQSVALSSRPPVSSIGSVPAIKRCC
ncbi:hypothetical protein J5N97_029532 [Dioscorea zingiberensis]|uniref:Uncharacterized protein n=1 Tax=Dioscorea zingiberensis TaxID=325984 RepID=A0A9D5H5Y9_9LILI|nr:hypothetical protein J5N97_029532 [Dioscorea zingiberensis]